MFYVIFETETEIKSFAGGMWNYGDQLIYNIR